jgi:hypothetical protein
VSTDAAVVYIYLCHPVDVQPHYSTCSFVKTFDWRVNRRSIVVRGWSCQITELDGGWCLLLGVWMIAPGSLGTRNFGVCCFLRKRGKERAAGPIQFCDVTMTRILGTYGGQTSHESTTQVLFCTLASSIESVDMDVLDKMP